MAEVIFNDAIVENMNEIMEYFECVRDQEIPLDVAVESRRFQRNIREVIYCIKLSRKITQGDARDETPNIPIP